MSCSRAAPGSPQHTLSQRPSRAWSTSQCSPRTAGLPQWVLRMALSCTLGCCSAQHNVHACNSAHGPAPGLADPSVICMQRPWELDVSGPCNGTYSAAASGAGCAVTSHGPGSLRISGAQAAPQDTLPGYAFNVSYIVQSPSQVCSLGPYPSSADACNDQALECMHLCATNLWTTYSMGHGTRPTLPRWHAERLPLQGGSGWHRVPGADRQQPQCTSAR